MISRKKGQEENEWGGLHPKLWELCGWRSSPGASMKTRNEHNNSGWWEMEPQGALCRHPKNGPLWKTEARGRHTGVPSGKVPAPVSSLS